MMKRICSLVLALAASTAVTAFLRAADMTFLPFYPFKVGERMLLTIHVLGVYIGDQVITVEDLTETNGKRVVVGSGHLYTTPFISSLYKVDDTERTWFLPENFVPLYYERWINEGNWKDNIKFHFKPEEQKVMIAQKVNGWRVDPVSYQGTLRNYFTLIACMRSVDYDYHILSGTPVVIDYLFGTMLKTAKFKPQYRRMDYKGKGTDVIYLEEIGGIGMNFYISRDADRTPLKLIIPAFEVLGFKTISVDVELKEYVRGTVDILPLSLIPESATNIATNAPASSTNPVAVSSVTSNTNAVTNAVKIPKKPAAKPKSSSSSRKTAVSSKVSSARSATSSSKKASSSASLSSKPSTQK